MPEETVVETASVNTPVGVEIITPGANMFSDDAWSATPVVAEPPKAEDGGSAAPAKETPAAKTEDSEIVEELEYLEKQTGYKSWDDIKALKVEAEQLREKAKTPAEIKFANEQSKKLFDAWAEGKEDDVYNFLDTQRQLKKAVDLPAADAIKLHLKQTNPHFKPEDVEDVFKERYSVPKKPIQRTSEEVEEFQERMEEYTEQVGRVTRAIERDGISAKQDLAKRITELVPPEIPKKANESQGPTQEELAGRKAFIENFVKAIPKELENFKGYATTFKDEAVELPISYGVTPEEIKEFQTELEAFANANMDTNTLFKDRWVNKDGTVNIQQIAEDRYLLKNRDKIFQKIANESGAKRLAHQIKLNSNIKVDGKVPPTEAKKDDNAAMLETFWNA